MAEALRRAGENSLCIIDEFGKGTDTVSRTNCHCNHCGHYYNFK